MDILLISPPLPITRARNTLLNRKIQYNFGLCCLTTNLNNAGFKIGIIDGFASNLNEDDIINYIKKYQPKIVSFSTLSTGLRNLYSILNNADNAPRTSTLLFILHFSLPNFSFNEKFG